MAKKRRERDRPKAALDAPYNPNKRVLLSYASDDENEDTVELPAGTGHPGAVDTVSADYEIAAYPDDEEDSIHEEGEVYTSGTKSEGVVETAAGGDGGAIFTRGVTKSVATGQWPALGSLSYQYDEDEEDGEYDSTEEEAMAYLRAVRSERQNLPDVFAAPHTDAEGGLYESGLGDSRGFMKEGTYIARPVLGPAMPQSAKTTMEPQEAYTSALRQRFIKQREQMHVGPSEAALASLGNAHPITCPQGNNKAYAEWTRLLTTTGPLPAQVRSMDHQTVYILLAIVQRIYLVRSKDIAKITSAWIWSLLARLDDVGTMGNDQVFEIREFGKKAVLVQLSMHDPAAAEQLEAVGADPKAKETDSSEIAITEQDLEEPKDPDGPCDDPRPASDDSPMRQNTLATLDMIVNIVGDVFGQRDLLEFRQPWQAPEDVQQHKAT